MCLGGVREGFLLKLGHDSSRDFSSLLEGAEEVLGISFWSKAAVPGREEILERSLSQYGQKAMSKYPLQPVPGSHFLTQFRVTKSQFSHTSTPEGRAR